MIMSVTIRSTVPFSRHRIDKASSTVVAVMTRDPCRDSAASIAPELLHRVTAIATGGLDALPHNGAVITLLAICKLTHRQAYFDIFVVAVLSPIAALVAVVALGTLFGAF